LSRIFSEDRHRRQGKGSGDEDSSELSLLSLPGVGRSKAQLLINAGFRALEDLAKASIEDLESIPGLGPKTAAQLKAGAIYVLSQRQEAESTRPAREASVVRLQPAPAAPEIESEAQESTGEDPAEIAPDRQADAGSWEGRDGKPSPVAEQEHDISPAHEPHDHAAPDVDVSTAPERERAAPAAEEIRNDDEESATVEAEPSGEVGRPVDAVPSPSPPAKDPVEVHLTVHIDNSVLAKFPSQVAREFEVVPMQMMGDTLLVASDDSLDAQQIERLSERVGRPIESIPSQVANVEATLRTIYEDNLLRSRAKGLGEILIDLGLITPRQLGQALAQQMRENNPSFEPVLSVDPEALKLVPESLAREHNILPIYRSGSELVIAVSEQPDPEALNEISTVTGLNPNIAVVGPSELAEAMSHCYRARLRHEIRQMWLGEILISRGLVNRRELDTCLAAQKESRQKLGELLVQNGYISEDALYPILAEKLGMEYRRIENTDVDYQLSYLVSERFAERNLVLPLKLDYDNGTLDVAIADPTNIQVRDMLETVAEGQSLQLNLILASPSKLRESISYSYNFHRQMEVVADDLEIEPETEWDEEEIFDRHEIAVSQDLPKMRRVINKLLYEAVTESASDIHIENLETRVQVRFRIDGILHDRTTPINKGNIQKVISVLKIDSGLNIAERRRAQDGVFKMRIGKDRNIDFRINVHATQHGEDAVIRVLDRSKNLLELGDLGMASSIQARYEALVGNPQGLILITGPTGSGKTTTLYTTLHHLNTGDKKIVTAEDPVEYHLDGITQYQVNNLIGNTFAEYTRRFLRKDPDIILVGETRDDETAIACIRAAMTGHLVFSTLHTNDAIAVVQRLRDLGVDSSSISDALLCVMQQRLARRNCPDCRKPYQPAPALMREFYPSGNVPPEAHFLRGSGCSTCHGQGLKGRVGLYEFWEVKRETREVIAARADEGAIRESAAGDGLTPLVEDALRKVYAGTTTLEELRRVVPVEQIRSFTGFYKYQ
jgi:type IV pilus assembly protein PilB